MQKSKKQEEIPDRSFNLKILLIILFFAAIVGAAIYKFIKFLGYIFTGEKIWNEADEINYLESVLESYEPDDVDYKVLEKGKRIKEALSKEFRFSILGNVRYQGSVDRGTSLSGLSDLDILIQFKKTSFYKTRDMYNAMYKFLKCNFNDSDLIEVRKQRVSIGLIYKINEKTIDVVPALRTDFIKGKNEYNLHVNAKSSRYEEEVKINPHLQRDFGDYSFEKIKVITLVKLLKSTQKLPLKSILIKELTIRAFQDLKMPKKLNLSLISVLAYIRDNILSIKINSPDNKNVSLTERLSNSEKKHIKYTLDDVLYNLKNDKNYLLDYFPEK